MDKHKTVLVIDDDAHIRRIVEIKLKQNGYKVLTARNGEEGRLRIERDQPDAVVSDINMPKLDGQTLCESLNHLKADRPFLTVIMTARISLDERQWIEQMIDTQFMEKPFSPNKLLQALDQYFGFGNE